MKLAAIGAAVTMLAAAGAYAQTSTMMVTWTTVSNDKDFGTQTSINTYNNEVQQRLGPNGFPILNTAAYGGTAPYYNGADVVSDLTAAGEIAWWNPTLNSHVVPTGIGVVSLPFSSVAMDPPNGKGGSDLGAYQTAVFTATLTIPYAEAVTFNLGADDNAFLYVDGGLVACIGGLHGINIGSYSTPTLSAGNHTVVLYYADVNGPGAALSFSVVTANATLTAPPPPSLQTMSVTWFTVANDPDFGGNFGQSNVTDEVQAGLGAHGLPLLNTQAFGGTSPYFSGSNPVTDLTAAGEMTWWSPSLNPHVTQTGTAVVSVPYNGVNLFAPNAMGSADGHGVFQCAIFRGTLYLAAAQTVPFLLGADDEAFLYVDGRLIIGDGGIHGQDSHSATVALATGNHSVTLFYADVASASAQLSFSIPAGVAVMATPATGVTTPMLSLAAPGATTGKTGGAVFSPSGSTNGFAAVQTNLNQVALFDSAGNYVTAFGSNLLSAPTGIALTSDNSLWVTDTGNNRVVVFDASGNLKFSFGTAGSAPGQFLQPGAISVNPSGDIVVADSGNSRLQIFNQLGNFISQVIVP